MRSAGFFWLNPLTADHLIQSLLAGLADVVAEDGIVLPQVEPAIENHHVRPARSAAAPRNLEGAGLLIAGRISLHQGERAVGKTHVEMAVGRDHSGRTAAAAALLPDHVPREQFSAERNPLIV